MAAGQGISTQNRVATADRNEGSTGGALPASWGKRAQYTAPAGAGGAVHSTSCWLTHLRRTESYYAADLI